MGVTVDDAELILLQKSVEAEFESQIGLYPRQYMREQLLKI